MNPRYSQICGLEEAKLAIQCLLVDPDMKGILIKGPPGVGKSVLMRSLVDAGVIDEPVHLPINADDSQIFGALDVEEAISTGKVVLSDSILSRADGHILMIDDLNLFDTKLMHTMMGQIIQGRVLVERDGISVSYPCSTKVVATVNTKEMALERTISDLFDICVTILPSTDREFRAEVIRTNLSEPPVDCNRVAETVANAKGRLKDVEITDDIVDAVTGVCTGLEIEGVRGDIAAVRTSRALAALDGRKIISREDVSTAVVLALTHRRIPKEEDPEEEDDKPKIESGFDKYLSMNHDREEKEQTSEPDIPVNLNQKASDEREMTFSEEISADIGEMFEAIDLADEIWKEAYNDPFLKRKMMKGEDRNGRYISSRNYNNGTIAIDATIRSSAPYQKRRGSQGRMDIRKQDLREKICVSDPKCMFLFMVDVSGSLVAKGRIRYVKAAIMAMLSDHYVRRDTVGIMTFNQGHIGIVKEPSRSVGDVHQKLVDMKVGKGTPLSEAIKFADDYLRVYRKRNPYDICFVIMMTDSDATTSMFKGADPYEEALAVACTVNHTDVGWTLIETSGLIDKTKGRRMAEALGARYILLDDVKMDLHAYEEWTIL